MYNNSPGTQFSPPPPPLATVPQGVVGDRLPWVGTDKGRGGTSFRSVQCFHLGKVFQPCEGPGLVFLMMRLVVYSAFSSTVSKVLVITAVEANPDDD